MFTKVKIYVKATFDCRLSWVRPDYVGRVDILEHEQTHFDLSELYARALRREIAERNLTAYNLGEANVLFKEVYALYLDRQELFEKETNYGLDRKKQQEWMQTVAKELDELSDYQ